MTDSVFFTVLRFDKASERCIREGCAAIARCLGRVPSEDVGPHLSLIPTDAADERALVEQLAAAVSDAPPLRVVLSHLEWFPGGVLSLGATPTRELLELHRLIHHACAPSPVAQWIELYQPGAWVPHCTLAMNVPATGRDAVQKEAIAAFKLPMVTFPSCVELLLIDESRVESRHTFPLPLVPD